MMQMPSVGRGIALVLIVASNACGSAIGSNEGDAAGDAGRRDASKVDSSHDAALVDSGPDGSSQDGSPVDSSSVDACSSSNRCGPDSICLVQATPGFPNPPPSCKSDPACNGQPASCYCGDAGVCEGFLFCTPNPDAGIVTCGNGG
jgi:hypothetical protein